MKNENIRIIRWCALMPFLGTLGYAFFYSIVGTTFMDNPISGFDAFVLTVMACIAQFWWLFLISIVIIIVTTVFLMLKRKNNNF